MTSGHYLREPILRPAPAVHNAAGITAGRLSYFCLWAFVFSIPCGENVRLGGLLVVNLLGLLAFAAAALQLLATWEVRKPSALHYWMTAFVLWAAASLFWTIDWDSTLVRTSTYVQLVLVVWMIWQAAPARVRVRGLLEAYLLGAFVTAVRALVNFATGTTAAKLWAAEGREVWEDSRYSVAGMNENDLGVILALSIPITFYVLSRRRSPLFAVLGWVHLVACIIAVLLTGSRGSLLAIGAAMLMLPLSLSRLPRWQKIPSLAACAAAAAGAVALVPQGTWARLLKLGESISAGTMTHRTVIWTAGLEAFRDHALLGVGAGAYGSAIVRAVDIPLVAHNTFLSILVELGVVGLLIFLLFLAGMYHGVLKMPRLEARLWTVLLLTWAVGVSSLTWEYRKPTWVLFGILMAHIHSREPARKS